jgi:hypothetical protein
MLSLPINKCPECGYEMDEAAPVDGDEKVQPIAGDISICLNCGEVLIFTEALALRRADKTEELPEDAVAAQMFVRNRGRYK